MKKLTLITILTLLLSTCGCKIDKCSDGGPVAPKEQSYERSENSDPILPSPNVWWR